MPNKIEALVLLDCRKNGAYAITMKLRDIIDKHPEFCLPIRKLKILKDLGVVINTNNLFSPQAASFPVGAKINVSNNHYANKSPLLGLIGEYLAYGERAEHRILIEIYINLYFLVSEKFKYTDKDYEDWLAGKNNKILGHYKSSVESAARYLRLNIGLNDVDESRQLAEKINNNKGLNESEGLRSLRCLKLYSEGSRPKIKNSNALKSVRSIYIKGEDVSSHVLVHQENDETEIEQTLIGQIIPNDIKSQAELIKKYNKMKGQANRINRNNQLRAVDIGFLRPTAWKYIDALILDDTVNKSVRAVICLSLLCGRSMQDCKANIKLILSKRGFIRIDLNVPSAKKTAGCIPVDNKLYIGIPVRYYRLLSLGWQSIQRVNIASAQSAIKNLNAIIDVTPQKIARLFFYIANVKSGKSHAAMLFDSPLSTITTQLHYTITQKCVLSSLYKAVFDEYEELMSPQGLVELAQSGYSGIMNFPDPREVRNFIFPDDELSGMRKGFVQYAAENGSRSVSVQSVDYYSSVDQQSSVAIVNDKKRNGAQHARLSFFSKRSVIAIQKNLKCINVGPAFIEFKYKTACGYVPMSPKFFSSLKGCNLQMNSLRKIRRSFILHTGLDEEIIDSLYGHHYVGSVPISHQSSLSIHEIHSTCKSHILLFHALVEKLTNE